MERELLERKLDAVQTEIARWAARPIDESDPGSLRFEATDRHEDLSVEVNLSGHDQFGIRDWWTCSIWEGSTRHWASGDDPEQAFQFARKTLEKAGEK